MSLMGAGMKGGISTSSHKLSLLLGATGLPSGTFRATALSRDRCHPGALEQAATSRIYVGSNRSDTTPLTSANGRGRTMVCGAPVPAQHFSQMNWLLN